MPYFNGQRTIWAAVSAPFMAKMGSLQTSQVSISDSAVSNNFQFSSDNAAGTAAVNTHKICNASNQFEISTGQLIVFGEFRSAQLATPAAPTITINGTAGATSVAYKIVARAGSLQSAASSAGSSSTANATLSSTNSVTITWTAVKGANAYDIYRTTAGGTPSTTGLIGTVSAGVLTFTDTGLAGDSSTPPSVNTTGQSSGIESVIGDFQITALATPATPVAVVNGTAGATSNTYKVVARGGTPQTPVGNSAASAGVTPSTCAATLTATNSVTITWQPVPGAASYDVYRTSSGGTPSSTGKIANVVDANTLTDTGLAGDSTSAPSTNNTAAMVDTNGNILVQFPTTAVTSAVNGVLISNTATGTAPTITSGVTGGDANAGITLQGTGTGAVSVLTGSAAGTIVIGSSAQSGNITLGSSSAAASVLVANGAGAATVNVANVSTAGNTVAVSGAATAGGNTDVINLATGNAAATGKKQVNILTGTPGTNGNNQLMMGGTVASAAVSVKAAFTSYQAINYIASETGSNNAIAGALTDSNGNNVALAAGLRVIVKLAHTLQAGANTFNLNAGGAVNLKSSRNVANNIATAYAATGVIDMLYDGTEWVDMSQ